MSNKVINPKDYPSNAVLLRLSIAAIIRRIEFDTESLAQLIGAIPNSKTREGLVRFYQELDAAIISAKNIEP